MTHTDKQTMTRNAKIKWTLICGVAMAFLGATLMIIGIFLPPIGEIHPSVLTAIGEALTFSGSCFGISGNYQLKHERLKRQYHEKYDEIINDENYSGDNVETEDP